MFYFSNRAIDKPMENLKQQQQQRKHLVNRNNPLDGINLMQTSKSHDSTATKSTKQNFAFLFTCIRILCNKIISAN